MSPCCIFSNAVRNKMIVSRRALHKENTCSHIYSTYFLLSITSCKKKKKPNRNWSEWETTLERLHSEDSGLVGKKPRKTRRGFLLLYLTVRLCFRLTEEANPPLWLCSVIPLRHLLRNDRGGRSQHIQ